MLNHTKIIEFYQQYGMTFTALACGVSYKAVYNITKRYDVKKPTSKDINLAVAKAIKELHQLDSVGVKNVR